MPASTVATSPASICCLLPLDHGDKLSAYTCKLLCQAEISILTSVPIDFEGSDNHEPICECHATAEQESAHGNCATEPEPCFSPPLTCFALCLVTTGDTGAQNQIWRYAQKLC